MDSHEFIQRFTEAQIKAGGKAVEVVFIQKRGAESVTYKPCADIWGETRDEQKPKIIITHP